MIINVSKGNDYFSQRNNQIMPLSSCNVTAMIQALSILSYGFPQGAYEQPEDNLRAFIEMHGKSPEVHADLSEYTNLWMKQEVTHFSSNRKISDIFTEILKGRPVVISGTFPGYPVPLKKSLGHIVCLVGAEWNNETWIGPPDYVVIDDPYGDTLHNWNGSGNDIKLDYLKFINWIKPAGDGFIKWGHFFTKSLKR